MATKEVNDARELTALRRAVTQALKHKYRLGQYAVVWRNGRPVRLEPEELGGLVDYGWGASAPAWSVRESDPHPEHEKEEDS